MSPPKSAPPASAPENEACISAKDKASGMMANYSLTGDVDMSALRSAVADIKAECRVVPEEFGGPKAPPARKSPSAAPTR